ncbi:hypothetical protein CC79DRAFT_74184 [Sarocladium strictum]
MTDSGSFTTAGPCATAAASTGGSDVSHSAMAASSTSNAGSSANASASSATAATAIGTSATDVSAQPLSPTSVCPPLQVVTTPTGTAVIAATTTTTNTTVAPINNKRASSPNLASQHSNLSQINAKDAADQHVSNTRKSHLRDVSDESHPPQTLHSHRQNHNQSKLPAFRFADRLNGAASVSSPSLVPRGPPSPVSPNPDPSNTHKQLVGDTVISPTSTTHSTSHHNQAFPASPLSSIDSPTDAGPLSRSSTYPAASSQSNSNVNSDSPATTTTVDLSSRGKRSTSLPDSSPPASAPATETVVRERPWQTRRGPASRSSSDSAVSEGYLTTRSRQRILAAATDKSTKEGASGRRELLLPKTLSQTASHHERRDSASNRPPVSYKPPSGSATQSVPSTPVRVPPIRGFRSSVSRKSLNLDMNFSRPFEFPGDVDDPTHDHTLRALEGRRESDGQMTLPPSGAGADGGADDEGDMFLRIARQESSNRFREGNDYDDNQSSVSRVRASHRRPLSTNVATYTPTSPPQLTRRLSDQQESARSRRYLDDRGTEISRSNTTKLTSREKPASVHPGEETGRFRASQRPPLTPRASAGTHDLSQDGSYSTRRRPSITDSNSGSQARTPVFKSYAQQQTQGSGTKGYSSSPLVRSFELNGQNGQERGHGMEGTESTLSTAAPSTVWDELDDIRSRINRLELTGKLPSTSGAAVSRLSDDRPATAGTTVTTVSSSPKRHGAGVAQTEVGSTTSSQREAHPVLHTALTRSKAYLSPEVFRALENAANDAMSLSSMMGVPGQPGPISSGASTIGAGTTLTDRQLRRKADSVCRSLTELCVALGDDTPPAKAPQAAQSVVTSQTDGPSTPVASTSYHTQRRPSVPAEPALPKQPSSPKGLSKFEERRQTLLSGSLLPSPRVAGSSPSTALDANANRRSSLLIGRTRRAGTEEPEDGRGSSLLVRNRRAGTEEPDEGRKTSLLVRNRRGTIGEDDVESRLRAPSRATTEVNTSRREHGQPSGVPQEVTSPSYSALPRRRLPSSINTSHLASPSAPASAITPPTRRYLERSVPAQGAHAYPDAPVENRRVSMIGQSSLPARTASLSSRRQNRDSTITSISTSATAGGHYE